MWVNLNEKGKETWGNVFPTGKVPVRSMTFSESNVGKVILVAWTQLTEEQKAAVLQKISARSGAPKAPKEAILKDILKIGLPLRETYTTGTVVAETRFFI